MGRKYYKTSSGDKVYLDEYVYDDTEIKADVEELKDEITNVYTKSESDAKYLTEHQDVSNKADTSELAKTDRSLDALWKLNKGQTYDFESKTETGVNDAPSGAKYESVESLYGKSTQGENPSPSNPQPITDCVKPTVKVTGRNLCKTFPLKMITSTSGLIIENGGTSCCVVKTNGTGEISINGDFSKVSDNTIRIGLFNDYPSIGVSGARKTINVNTQVKSINTDGYKYALFSFVSISETSSVDDDFGQWFQIEYGSTPTDYEPYHETTHTLPYTIRGIGDVRDEVVINSYGSGQFIQRIGSVDLGSFSWTYSTSGNRFDAPLTNPKPAISAITKPNAICSKYNIGTPNNTWLASVDKILSINNVNGHCIISDTSYTDASTFKQAMNGVTLLYELSEPIITELSDLTVFEMLDATDVISVVDENGNDCSYLVEYVIKLDEVE